MVVVSKESGWPHLALLGVAPVAALEDQVGDPFAIINSSLVFLISLLTKNPRCVLVMLLCGLLLGSFVVLFCVVFLFFLRIPIPLCCGMLRPYASLPDTPDPNVSLLIFVSMELGGANVPESKVGTPSHQTPLNSSVMAMVVCVLEPINTILFFLVRTRSVSNFGHTLLSLTQLGSRSQQRLPF